MILSDDKKKRATLIISKLSATPEEKPKNEMGDEVDSDIGLMSAAEDIVEAVQSKDAKSLKHALKAFIEMCDAEEPESEEQE